MNDLERIWRALPPPPEPDGLLDPLTPEELAAELSAGIEPTHEVQRLFEPAPEQMAGQLALDD